jgi:hypothetical protein
VHPYFLTSWTNRTNYTIDQIVDQNKDGTPCLTGRCPGACSWMPTLGINASHPGAQPFYDSLYELFITEWMVEFVKADCEDSTRLGETLVSIPICTPTLTLKHPGQNPFGPHPSCTSRLSNPPSSTTLTLLHNPDSKLKVPSPDP